MKVKSFLVGILGAMSLGIAGTPAKASDYTVEGPKTGIVTKDWVMEIGSNFAREFRREAYREQNLILDITSPINSIDDDAFNGLLRLFEESLSQNSNRSAIIKCDKGPILLYVTIDQEGIDVEAQKTINSKGARRQLVRERIHYARKIEK